MKEFTLNELAKRSGVTARTIRLYITRGLVPRPLRAGRKAAYGPEHLAALEDIRRLQRKGLTLAEIRQRRSGKADGTELPEPVRWTSYSVAPDVVVMVREDVPGWRLKQVRNALLTFLQNVGGSKGEKEAEGT